MQIKWVPMPPLLRQCSQLPMSHLCLTRHGKISLTCLALEVPHFHSHFRPCGFSLPQSENGLGMEHPEFHPTPPHPLAIRTQNLESLHLMILGELKGVEVRIILSILFYNLFLCTYSFSFSVLVLS